MAARKMGNHAGLPLQLVAILAFIEPVRDCANFQRRHPRSNEIREQGGRRFLGGLERMGLGEMNQGMKTATAVTVAHPFLTMADWVMLVVRTMSVLRR